MLYCSYIPLTHANQACYITHDQVTSRAESSVVKVLQDCAGQIAISRNPVERALVTRGSYIADDFNTRSQFACLTLHRDYSRLYTQGHSARISRYCGSWAVLTYITYICILNCKCAHAPYVTDLGMYGRTREETWLTSCQRRSEQQRTVSRLPGIEPCVNCVLAPAPDLQEVLHATLDFLLQMSREVYSQYDLGRTS